MMLDDAEECQLSGLIGKLVPYTSGFPIHRSDAIVPSRPLDTTQTSRRSLLP